MLQHKQTHANEDAQSQRRKRTFNFMRFNSKRKVPAANGLITANAGSERDEIALREMEPINQ
jgi:hypothetical protein